MLLKFLEDPAGSGPRWLQYGGLQTLASFGVGASIRNTDAALETARNELAEAMGAPLLTWLRTLPTLWQTGNVAVVHAGADPAQPLEAQPPRVLKWGHREFDRQPRQDGVWVLHGHTIVARPEAANGRIAIDTGGYATGRLSAAYVSPGSVRFLQT